MCIVSSQRPEFWKEYDEYLKKTFAPKTAKDDLLYGQKYYHILETGEASDLKKLTPEMCRHVMKSVATLAKYTGRYKEWRDIKERHQLKWGRGDNLHIFDEIINGKNNYDEMLAWVKKAIQSIPKSYGNVLVYETLTGLRPTEALLSVGLLKRDCDKYLNKERGMLEHFKYPHLFIRRTKRAYISLVDKEILDVAKDAQEYSYMGLQSMLVRKGVPAHIKFCRKVFATHLRMSGIEPEFIDLLQGRTPRSVFGKHYFRPNFDKEKERLAKSIGSLFDQLC